MTSKVSVIIPVYNGEKFISSAISSILNQTFRNIEIIVVDDSSTDSSFRIAKKFESDSCKIIQQENAGAAAARNTGLAHATGEYIQFLDVDDFISKDKIEAQVKALENKPNKIAVCNFIEFFDEVELNEFKHNVDQSDFIYSSDAPVDFLINLYGGHGHAHFIQTNSWLTPKQLIEKVGGWRNYRCPDDDGEFFARVLLASEGIVYVPGVYNYYRRSADEAKLSNSTNRKYLQNALLTIDLKYRYLLHYVDNTALLTAIATQYLRFAVYMYPKHKLLSEIAYRRYKSIKSKTNLPKLGGPFIEVVKAVLGWKAARFLKYHVREKH